MTAQRNAQEGMRRATRRGRDEWFGLLHAWGAAGRPYKEITAWLVGEHDLTPWWAQKLTVEYQQARGLRAPGIRPDGTFTVTVSKTVAVPVERLYAGFTDVDLRERWLPGADMRQRASRPGRSVRFDWEDSGTRANVTFTASEGHKAQMAVEHERLADSRAAAQAKHHYGASVSPPPKTCSRADRADRKIVLTAGSAAPQTA